MDANKHESGALLISVYWRSFVVRSWVVTESSGSLVQVVNLDQTDSGAAVLSSQDSGELPWW
jgi:hypothetical protein